MHRVDIHGDTSAQLQWLLTFNTLPEWLVNRHFTFLSVPTLGAPYLPQALLALP